MELKNSVAWITGSSRGIGEATAHALANRGAKVVVSGRNEDDIVRVTGEINANGNSALAITCDVHNRADILDLIKQTKDVWGPIDILVNNAGIGIFKKIVDLEEEEWDSMMDINLKSAFLCSQAVLPDMMARQRGKIINIVSVAGKNAYENCGGYCASKFGLHGFSEVLRLETRQYGIQVTSILPGATSTDIWGDADVDHSIMIKPEHVAETIAMVCQAGDSAHIEEVILRPQNGDL
ncbi:SDR family oxidoreductase [candidate division KSB1 bacterium]|nr:SDR family oxidoreductase [candidate division KSB1 bacterium]RQV99926.1 MAG: SDR family oxidoreductase [candidate division KSB1 bacterium]